MMLKDLRYALRTLRQNPGFALVAIISLALGIGANAAIYSFADALLLRPLAVPNASGVMAVQSQMRGERIAGLASYSQVSYPDYRDLRDRSQSFSGLTAAQYSAFGFSLTKGVLPEMKFGAFVSGNFFSVLEVQPVLGRGFRPDEDAAPGRDAVVVIGHDLWKNSLASRPDAIGSTIYLNGLPFTVVGVAPEPFHGPYNLIRADLYVPFAMEPMLAGDPQRSMREDRGARASFVHGRLKPGVSEGQAAAEGRVISQQLAQAYPTTNRTTSLVVETDAQARMRLGVGNALIVGFLLALAAVVLLIACANVMNLMLSRARARSREIAVRLAMGAGRLRLVRQLLTESVVIALLGGVLGLVVAEAGVDLFSRIRIPGDIPIVVDPRLDTRVLLFLLLVSVASAILFGLAPALQSTRPDLVPALKSGRAEGGKRRRFFGRNTLVIGQVAGSVLLMVFATQSYRGSAIVLSSSPGFRTDHLLLASFNPGLARYSEAQTQAFYKNLLERARSLVGVKSAALTEQLPASANGGAARVIPEGVTLPSGTEALFMLANTVSDGYFRSIGIPLVEGREFQVTDRADSPHVAIVNELVAHKYYPNQSAIGKRFRIAGSDRPPVEIVGVAKLSKYAFMVEPPFEYIYLPLSQNPQPRMVLLLQTEGPSGAAAAPLRQLVQSLDSQQPVFNVSTMEDYFDQRATQTLGLLNNTIAGMGLLGLILALVGLYGLMTYSVGLRQREIGIRMAVGAAQTSVLKMMLRQGMVLAGTGVGIGLLLSILAGNSTTAVIGTSNFYLPLVALVCVGLLAAAGLGVYIPARRASRLDPNVVLRQE
jgi:macrolide transport system ATP-binding/permease protein